MPNVLVVDDSVLIRSMVGAALKQINYHIIEADTAAKALQLCSTMAVDLVLLDVELEDANGLDVCQRIKAAQATIPVILMSGYTADDLELTENQQAPDFFLAKPFTIQAIQDLAQQALDL